MHKPNLFFRLLSLVLPCLFIMAGSMVVNAQRSSEKYITLVSGQQTLVDQIIDPNLLGTPEVISQVGQGYAITINPTSKEIFINQGSTASGYCSFTIKYVIANPVPKDNYRIYHLTFVKSTVKVNDDVISWNGSGSITIDPLANDEFTGTVTLSINQASGNASVVNNQIVYSNTAFSGMDYIQYSIKDSLGTSDQGIIKMEEAMSVPEEDQTHSFVVNYQESKNITIPAGFDLNQFPFNGEITGLDDTHFLYTPDEYFIGQDSFTFTNAAGLTLDYHAKIIDAERDPGFVRNDVFYTGKNTPITFDVFANDLVNTFPIVEFSPQLVHDTLGIFSYTPSASFSGTKVFSYKVDSGVNVESGKITLVVGNQQPQSDLLYNYTIPGNASFVIEYDVPISGYSFTIDPAKKPKHGEAYAYQDSTSGLSCGTAYGKALLSYTPDPGFTGVDTMEVKYCVINNPVCVTYKLRFNVQAPNSAACPCIDDCVWRGDLNGDGKVSAHDLLTLGRFLGYEGPARDTSSLNAWGANEADNWGVSLANGKDLKHADANGDGRLTAEDMQGILDNFNKLSSLVPNEALGYKEFPFILTSNYSEVGPGDTLVIYFALGSANYPANDIHGLSFALNIDGSFVDSSSLKVKFFDNTWMTDHSPTLQFHKQVSDGNVRLAFTRSGGKGASGNGIIGQAIWIVGEEDADGLKSNKDYVSRVISVEDIAIENSNGNTYLLKDNSLLIKQVLSKNTDAVAEAFVFPNPTRSQLQVVSTPGSNLEIINAQGVKALTTYLTSESESVDVGLLPAGLYYVRIYGAWGSKVLAFTKL